MKKILISLVLLNSAFTITMAGGVETKPGGVDTIYKLSHAPGGSDTKPGGVETILASLGDPDQESPDLNEVSTDFYPVSDDNVPASLVYAVENVSAAGLNASLVTIFRGSAQATSSVIVTFSQSLEDNSTSYEFYNLKDAPTNVSLKEISKDKFELSFDGEFLSYDKAKDEAYFAKKSLSFLIQLDSDGNVVSFAKTIVL